MEPCSTSVMFYLLYGLSHWFHCSIIEVDHLFFNFDDGDSCNHHETWLSLNFNDLVKKPSQKLTKNNRKSIKKGGRTQLFAQPTQPTSRRTTAGKWIWENSRKSQKTGVLASCVTAPKRLNSPIGPQPKSTRFLRLCCWTSRVTIARAFVAITTNAPGNTSMRKNLGLTLMIIRSETACCERLSMSA